ncbi:MAG: hypothetical protein H0U21_10575 [Acidimicrobiia bacterium]|nr:hypothetical protein [Acidimicrobiia bacterium]
MNTLSTDLTWQLVSDHRERLRRAATRRRRTRWTRPAGPASADPTPPAAA